MKKFFYITICFFTVFLIYFLNIKKTSAIDCRNPSGCTVGIGETANIIVEVKDDYGNPITGSVKYDWTVSTAGLGTFTQSGSTTWSNTTTNGSSTVTLSVPGNISAQAGIVKVVATSTYGGESITTNFNITVICSRDPKLYFGIGEVKDSGPANNNWQKSTTELLETCFNEYKLFGGMGSRY